MEFMLFDLQAVTQTEKQKLGLTTQTISVVKGHLVNNGTNTFL